MPLNWEATDSYWFVDQENKMMLFQNPIWKIDGDNGRGDAIGRSAEAFFVYGDYRFIEGIESCWEKVYNKGIRRLFKKYYYQGYRYPQRFEGEVGLSRDHLFNTVLAYKIAGKNEKEIWKFVKHLRWRISDFAIMTPDLWLWLRAASGRKIAKWLSPRVSYYTMKMTAWWQKRIQKKIKIGPDFEENQDTFHHIQNEAKPEHVKKKCKLLYPVYALQQQAWQSRFYEGEYKKKIQDVIYSITPTYNYVIKLLVDHPEGISEEDIMSYKSMKGGRWTGVMNIWWNDRALEINTNADQLKYNVQDVDYLRKLWKENENS